MKRPGALTSALALAGLLCCGVVGWLGAGARGGGGVATHELHRGRFVRRVTADGYLRARQVTPLVAPMVEGSLKLAFIIEDGAPVKAGDVIARFDATEFERALTDGNADRERAAARIGSERSLSGATLRGRDLSATLADEELRRRQAQPRKDPEIFSRNQIIEAELDESLAHARRGHAAATRGLEAQVSAGKLALLQLDRARADQAIGKAEKNLRSLLVKAPHDGIAVLETDWRGNPPRVGDTIWGSQRLASLPLLSEMEVEALVLEADAGGVAAGVPAQVVIEAHPETVYPAKVRTIDALAKPRQREVPINYFSTALALEKTDVARMRPGQRARVTLVLDQADALVLPRQAVLERDGKKVALRLRQGVRPEAAGPSDFEAAPLTLGASSPGLVVVTAGLGEGDRVALRDPAEAPRGRGNGANAKAAGAGPALGGKP